MVALGNFKPLNAILDKAYSGAIYNSTYQNEIRAVQSQPLSNASWAAWSKIDPSGSSVTSTFQLTGIDWKSVIGNLSNDPAFQ